MTERNVVPCNGCQACCRNQRILLSQDEIGQYDAIPTLPGLWMLRHKPNGDCIYLTETGCGIHNFAPKACRRFDCRAWYLQFPEDMRSMLDEDDPFDGPSLKAAKARI